VPPIATKVGCVLLEIRLTTSPSATVAPVPDEACGEIAPVLVGSARYDPAQRIVRLTVALRNGGLVQLHSPTAVIARRGSLIVTNGTAVGGALRFVTSDSVPGDSLAPGRADSRWSFDGALVASGATAVLGSDGSVVLPDSATSKPRTLAIVVPRGVTGFRVALYATGANVFTVPAQAPAAVPLDEVEDSRSPANVVTQDPRFPGRVARNKLWLAFRHDATPDQRQAAVDAVQGVVVGGRRIGTVAYYYLRIPANPDSGGGPLEQAIRALAIMPQVQHVMPDNVALPGLAH
jgi:hypothetical protein